ncbi:amidohydrolase family protein [Lutispora sp.]|nr:amidohydrolase family protein [Lutispora sp.]MEA4963623.1 amidohydrolase family protein [Lutispora sp.]
MILIKKGILHDGNGRILDGADILIENTRIKDIGYDLKVSGLTEVVDAKDKVILPGLIDSLNIWGCMGPGWDDNDLNEHSNPVTPAMDVVYSFDQDSMMFQRVFEYGVTSAGITPSTKNVIGGNAAVFKTYGDHPYKMLVKEKAAMISSITAETKKLYGSKNLTPMTKMGAFSLLTEALRKALEYKGKKEKDYNGDYEALLKVLDKEMPLFINCSTKADMDAAEMALKDFDIDVVFTGAFGIHKDVTKILGRRAGIVLGDLTCAMSYKNSMVDFFAIKRLVEEDMDIAISSCGDNAASGKESLLWNAILYYKNGLDSEDVLKMITSIPSKILGVDNRIGSVEIGKDADLSIWSANPIETYAARAEAVYINGENILNSRRVASCW